METGTPSATTQKAVTRASVRGVTATASKVTSSSDTSLRVGGASPSMVGAVSSRMPFRATANMAQALARSGATKYASASES
jgi:hypothetical protein